MSTPQKPRWQRALISQDVAQKELRGRKVWVKAIPPQHVDVRVLGHPEHVVNTDQRHYFTNLRSGIARI